MKQPDSPKSLTRRTLLQAGIAAGGLLATPLAAFAAAPPGFDQWRDNFRARALAKGISEATWTRVMGRIEPDMSVFRQMQKQPEFNEQIWQYINRRVSDWRIINGREALKKNEALFARIEQDFGVERGTLLALWGVESAYGDPLVQQNHMRPVFPSLAALAWNEPRRKAYWETELINALQDRRPRLEHAGGDARLLGRRDGSYPVDAGSLAQCRHGLRQGRPGVAVRQAGRCARLQRALSGQPRQISPRRALGL